MGSPERLDDVLLELGQFFNGELATTQLAIGALRTVAHQMVVTFESSDDTAETRLLGPGVPDSGWVGVFTGLLGAQQFQADVAEGGHVHQRLTQQWVVTVYTAWEEDFRGRVAAARGASKNDVASEFFGDLRRLRHDIVHHRGVASADHSARCGTTAVVQRKLAAGDPIYISDEELTWMHFRMPWSELEGRA